MQLVNPSECGRWGLTPLLFWAVIHPSSVVRTQWDLYVLAVLFSVCIITPFLICFDLDVKPSSVLGMLLAAGGLYTAVCFTLRPQPARSSSMTTPLQPA